MKNKSSQNIFAIIITTLSLVNIYAYGQNLDQTNKIVASDRFSYDNFGTSVAIYGNTAIIGAPQKTVYTSFTEFTAYAGSAYVYDIDENGIWKETQQLTPSNTGDGYNFGQSVDIYENLIIIGAKEHTGSTEDVGAAYIFERNEIGVWNEVTRLQHADAIANDNFGSSVSINNKFAIVGTFKKTVEGKTNAGAVYVFKNNNDNTWTESQKITASDTQANDNFGNTVSIDKNTFLVGAKGKNNNTGCAYFFTYNSSNQLWEEQQKVSAADVELGDSFGFSVSITEDKAIIGANNEGNNSSLIKAGAAYIFKQNSSNQWIEDQKIVADDRSSEDLFGSSVAIFQDYAIVGAEYEDEDISGSNTLSNSGSAYYYHLNSSGSWTQIQKIKASDKTAGDSFGCAVDIFGNKAIIGAFNESHDANGANQFINAGSGYMFSIANTHVIESVAGPGGNIEPSGFYILEDGDYVTYTITPENNFIISAIKINGVSTVIQNTMTISDLTSDKKIEVSFDITSSINSTDENKAISIYPNPAHEYITISVAEPSENKKAQIINTNGQVVKVIPLNTNKSTTTSVSELPKGTYLLIINKHIPKKFTVI
ncbi:T9SS type A sorting domain-containing protein [Plebeiibacterium sediminum]|uniref:T9SS type A sorting domain-containing protein n=1 Tax=Plebeiibacterium sediminum TaxID=2992112 RepID=A0AAE3M428_9BACT|nr:T9SS type A sorting domain-containing protein [Plebeiobacterium sediminum]MCW3786410.1 T9SS type A sorting domain-containing protein [Plebeiobacterium sediminum]